MSRRGRYTNGSIDELKSRLMDDIRAHRADAVARIARLDAIISDVEAGSLDEGLAKLAEFTESLRRGKKL